MGKATKVKPKRVLCGRPAGTAIKPKSVFAGVEPTPEQQKQRPFAIEPVVDEGQVKARAYRRQPLYVTLAKTSTPLTADQRQALDVYRELHDRSERSFTRSCLDIDHQGQMRRPDDVVHVNKAIREAREAINRVEAALGPIVSTLRAVALEDRSFSDVAMERFGSRKREWLKVDEPVRVNGRVVKVNGVVQRHPVFVEEIVPRSNKHRELIKQEYDQAVQMLARVVGAQNQARGAEEVWVSPLASGRARISHGVIGPRGCFRMRGGRGAVDAAIAEIAQKLGGELDFADHASAKAALCAAAVGRLVDIDADSVAA